MFVNLNPSVVERAAIIKEFPNFDWGLFGAASDEEGGLSYLEEHLNIFCDDAKQNRFHTKSVLEVNIAEFSRQAMAQDGAEGVSPIGQRFKLPTMTRRRM